MCTNFKYKDNGVGFPRDVDKQEVGPHGGIHECVQMAMGVGWHLCALILAFTDLDGQ